MGLEFLGPFLYGLVVAGTSVIQAQRAKKAMDAANHLQAVQQKKAVSLQKEQLILSQRAQEQAESLYADQQNQLRDKRQYDASLDAESERKRTGTTRAKRNTMTIKYTGMNADELLGIRIPQ